MFNYFDSPIFVLGLPRSGTSLIAGSLNICGAWVGSTFPGDENNPEGFFEHKIIRENVTKNILKQLLGCDPLGVRKLPPIKYEVRDSNLKNIIWKILKDDGYEDNRSWLYKCPKLSLTWQFFLDAFPNAKWVIVTRDHKSIIDSILRTNFMNQHSTDYVFWENFINQYNIRINELKNSTTNYKEIISSHIVEKNYISFIDIVNWLGLTFKKEAIEQFVYKPYYNFKH